MMTANSAAPELLRLGTIREILRSPGPCITMVLPPYRPGEPEGSPAILVKTNVQRAAQQFAEHAFPKSASASLLEPLQRLAEEPEFNAGSHWGRAIFRSATVFQQFHLTQPVKAPLSVGGSFSIRPLAPELARPPVFYILALSKTRVTLLRCTGLHVELTKLPPGVPDTLAEALALKPPDHNLENRSAAGSSTGAMHSVRFGTGSGREREHVHLADFYKLVDRGVQELFREPEIPLILAGVEEDTAMFRAVSNYRGLVEKGIVGSPDVSLQQDEILQLAHSILRTDGLERQAAALLTAKERATPSRFSTDPDTILRAAFDGRVGQLYLNESAERIDVFERGTYRSLGKEDLLNLAAVQTIIHHGKAGELPAEMMPDGSIAAGILRF